MTWRTLIAALVVAFAAGTFGYYLTFPEALPAVAPVPVSSTEYAQTIASLKPTKRAKPLVAVIGANDGSETTDYVIPYGVIKRSGVADVVSLGVGPGPVTLMPALTIIPDSTLQEFDRRYPEGADYVIVPAFHDRKKTAALAWLNEQSAKGAMIVGICEGALVMAEAGLLKGKHATTHWHAIGTLQSIEPDVRYAPDRRYVIDGRVVTTTGVSASLPVSLAIVEAIGGREVAQRVASGIGVSSWDAAHASRNFQLTRRDVRTFLSNSLAFWRHESVGIPVADGVDEISLAFVADAYANTFAAGAYAVGSLQVVSMNGLHFVTQPATPGMANIELQPGPSVEALDKSLHGIALRYGDDTSAFVRLSLEYPERR